MRRRTPRLSGTAPLKCEGCESDPALATCIECQQYLCTNCVKVHKNIALTRVHRVIFLTGLSIPSTPIPQPSSTNNYKFCSIHHGSEVKFFCKTCEVPTCSDCTIVTHRIPDHVHIPLKEAVDACRSDLVKMAMALEERSVVLSKGMAKTAEFCHKLNTNLTREKDTVRGASREMNLAVSREEKSVIDDIEHERAARMKPLNLQVHNLESKHKSLKQAFTKIQKYLHSKDYVDLLSSKHCTEQHIMKLIDDTETNVTKYDLEVLPRGEKVSNLFRHKQPVCVSNCTIGGNVEYMFKGQAVAIPISTKDCMGRHVVGEHKVKAIHIKPDGSPQKLMQVIDNGDGAYSVTLHGDVEGNHKIILMIGDIAKPGPPFTVQVIKGLVKTIGQKGDGKLQFNNICGIAINTDGDIVAADKDNNRLQIIDISGKCKDIIALEEQFRPIDVAILNNDNYVVVGDQTNKVALINTIRNTISYFGMSFLDRTRSIAVCPITNLVYVLNEHWPWNVFAKVFTQEGAFVKSIKLKRSTPNCIRIDSEGKLFVCVTNNNNVDVYDKDGPFLYRIPEVRKSGRMLYKPAYLAFDDNGYLYVSGDNKLQKFDCLGNFICQINTHEDGLKRPSGIAIMNNLTVAVADSQTNCIKLFVQ
ncbi:E3 ubiquitin-protein ligase TRIM71-like [Saccoglossus kowalevskii]|uniref:E3 ubiquitin-protein ligase TRIM71-like n=1 Tax=Saccoglossus kowalevskii TaxID=10224 RepID=A0ABM0ME59_SACKO|nr:PREDICTED: E3 ubiquitin-protein ligase TRIM71-like [Saccoglossus kowalevskii]